MPPPNPSILAPDTLLSLLERTRTEPEVVVLEAAALLPAARQSGNRRALVMVMTALASGQWKVGQHDQARTVLDEALDLAGDDPLSEARVRKERLAVFVNLGDTRTVQEDEARLTLTLDALTELRERTAAMNVLAGTAFQQGRPDDAGRWLERASHSALEGGDRAGATMAATNAAMIRIELGQYPAALGFLRNALHHADSTQAALFVQAQHAFLYEKLDQFERALTVIDQYFAGRAPTSPSESDKAFLITRAASLLGLNRLAEAAATIEAHALHNDAGHRLAGEARDTLGHVYSRMGRTAQARGLLLSSLETFERGGVMQAAARPLLGLAELELPENAQLSLAYARRALSLLEGQPSARDHARALRLQAQAHAATGEYRLAYTLGEQHRALQDDLNRQQERRRLEVALAELEYGRTQAMARVQRDALREARAEVAELHANLEARVVQRTQELQAANEELRAFAHSVSHYLRTPLQLIVGYAALLGQLPEARRARPTQAIADAADRMAGVLDGLLAYASRSAAVQAERAVDLGAVVRVAWQDQTNPQRVVRLDVGRLPLVRGDPAALRVVFGNLLHNAVKFTRECGEPLVQVSASLAEGEVTVEVRDNGVGFDPQDATRLFGAFTRLPTTARFEGLGVGLADVWRIVIAHGGHVRAEGRPGEGASFFVTLPAATPVATAP